MGDVGPVVNDLRRLKYRLAVDDLGTGYAGLASFTQLSPEFVKLDRSLIVGIDKHPTKQRVVQAMYHLCADLGMTVISEGIDPMVAARLHRFVARTLAGRVSHANRTIRALRD
jgi:EAL domain-containing protein (putative c-di-GMP-specific phosphodiesterase class I)